MIIENKESKNLFDKILAMNDTPIANEDDASDIREGDVGETSHDQGDQVEHADSSGTQQTESSPNIPDTSKPGEFIRWVVKDGKPEITGSTLNDEVLLDSVLEIGASLKGKDRFDFFSKNCASFGYDMADLTRRVKTLEEGDIDKQADILEDIVKQNIDATKKAAASFKSEVDIQEIEMPENNTDADDKSKGRLKKVRKDEDDHHDDDDDDDDLLEDLGGEE